ncbi:hypothetical protein BXO88_04085 [Oribacterium sp. C9]|uniref:hypothetical protein n=1 Tax=Oribacterium sp. C9 TaxID=1943579 RepID=UPI0009C5AA30|nr:hypothetical protein [Oribacterium sp. C9]OON87458.1 hypothetical protein BXO88_04085 [Oribacterium sp. C9]
MNQVISKTDVLNQLLKDVTGPIKNDSIIKQSSSSVPEEEIIDLGNNFDFNGFQVVRREFFAHIHEPAVTLCNCKFYVNSACLQRFPDTNSVQVLINQNTKVMAIKPCPPDSKDSFIWCSISKGKRKPRQITCKIFFAKLVSLMQWNPDYRYKLLGKMIHANGETLIAFDLTATEVFQRTVTEGSKAKTSKTPIFPAEWQNQFGLSYNEHQQYMEIDIFDGYAVYSIKDNSTIPKQKSNVNHETTSESKDAIHETLIMNGA